MKAKKTKKKQSNIDNIRPFFDGSTFRNGKGIRSKILAAVQYICSSLVRTQSPGGRYYEKIICQSSEQALESYKVAMGFIEITDSTTIPTTVLNRFIKSQQVTPINFTGRLQERRPTKVRTRQDIHHIFCQALFNMFAVKHNKVSNTVYNLPGYIQHRGSAIYYSADDNKLLSEKSPDIVDYKDYDKKLYTNAGKRATHDDSVKNIISHFRN
jgi:hypothetical protein